MNILYMDWNSFCRIDVLSALEHLNHTCHLFPLTEQMKMLGIDVDEVGKIEQKIKEIHADAVFSMNYFPMVSEACQRSGVPYLSWIYDSPYQKAYGVNIINDCNFIFTFDSAMYESLASKGVSTIYYAPMAANPKRLTSYTNIPNKYIHDISFVGALYNEDHNFYDEFVKQAKKDKKEHWIGYVDALIQAQLHIYGTNILANTIKPEIVESGYTSINPWTETTAFFTTPTDIFCDNVLCRRITAVERQTLLSKLSSRFDVALYTRNPDTRLGACQNLGYVDYKTEMPLVFRGSKINLNISLKSIKNGIPLRAIEIMGAGGFLLSNFQNDFLLHFEPDKDFVYYETLEDAIEKSAYYLSHDSEREQIAHQGLEKIKAAHTYEQRLSEMLSLI